VLSASADISEHQIYLGKYGIRGLNLIFSWLFLKARSGSRDLSVCGVVSATGLVRRGKIRCFAGRWRIVVQGIRTLLREGCNWFPREETIFGGIGEEQSVLQLCSAVLFGISFRYSRVCS
jgi:hypothetical protein